MLKEELNDLDVKSSQYAAEFINTACEHLREYVESITHSLSGFDANFYICPCCKSGTGNNHHYTPAFHLFRNQKGRMNFKCHACGISGDIFTLAGLVNGTTSFKEQQKIIASFLGIDLSRRTPLSDIKIADTHVSQTPTKKEAIHLKTEAREYILECRKHIHETNYFAKRGLSEETIARFGLGYDPKKQLAIIPFTMSYYMGRNVQVGMDQKGVHKHYKPAGLRQPLFNMAALSAKPEEPVFIVEAPLDAISIIQSGGNSLALGGKSTSILEKVLDIYRPERHFVLAFDHDAAGLAAQQKVFTLLKKRGLSCSLPAHSAFSRYKDANAILVADPQALQAAIALEKELQQKRLKTAFLSELPIKEARQKSKAISRPKRSSKALVPEGR